MRIGGEQIA